jgi:hypothetical protein
MLNFDSLGFGTKNTNEPLFVQLNLNTTMLHHTKYNHISILCLWSQIKKNKKIQLLPILSCRIQGLVSTYLWFEFVKTKNCMSMMIQAIYNCIFISGSLQKIILKSLLMYSVFKLGTPRFGPHIS